MLDIRELIRRLQLGETTRQVAQDLGVGRRTVMKYHAWAEREGLMSGPLPSPGELQTRLKATLPVSAPPRGVSKVEPYREKVVALRQQRVEARAIYGILKDENGFEGSYPSVWRFVRALESRTPEACVRVETAPGEEAQVDFGTAGLMLDPRDRTLRRAWAFVMTLSFSRHQYLEFVFDQEVGTWLRCHRNAFEWLGGVPQRVVLDNLKAAIIKATAYDPGGAACVFR